MAQSCKNSQTIGQLKSHGHTFLDNWSLQAPRGIPAPRWSRRQSRLIPGFISLAFSGMMVRFGWCAFLTVVADLQHFNLGLNSLRTVCAWLLLGWMISLRSHIRY